MRLSPDVSLFAHHNARVLYPILYPLGLPTAPLGGRGSLVEQMMVGPTPRTCYRPGSQPHLFPEGLGFGGIPVRRLCATPR